MSLLRNVAGQNFTFALINNTNDAPLTGATVTVKTLIDNGAQAAGLGTVTELGHGAYNYAPTQAETNGACISFFFTAPSGVPENIMFLPAGGIHKNLPGQNITFVMFSTTGVADSVATVSVFVSKDGGAQAAGAGVVTNSGNGQYNYSPTAAELNSTCSSFLFSATGDVIQNLAIFTVP